MDIYSTKEYATEIKDAPYNFFRTPVYPLTIAAAYALFGIDPRYVKILQIGLVALCAAAIRLIASYYWGTSGFISGLISCSLFCIPSMGCSLIESSPRPLSCLGLSSGSVLFTLLEFRSSNNIDFFLGLLTGALILIKGSMLFLGIITAYSGESVHVFRESVHLFRGYPSNVFRRKCPVSSERSDAGVSYFSESLFLSSLNALFSWNLP